MPTIVWGAIVAVAGAAVFAFGWRGRRVGDHPFCRRCGFDLFGLPAESQACPECGGDLAAPRATVVGTRRRRPGVAGAGAALMLPSLAVLGVAAWGHFGGVDWQKQKPTWWLIR